MIAPIQNGSPADPRPLGEQAAAAFAPGGPLAAAAGDFEYEARPQQVDMARAIAAALEENRHLIVEAGTGVGKSFAYLVPLIHAAVARKIQAVVSTYTISLQEQLISKDIPFLKQHMGLDFKAVLVMGRSNYLCLRRLSRARRMSGELFKSEEQEELDRIRAWADKTSDGSIQEL